jgi:hypothetical protein
MAELIDRAAYVGVLEKRASELADEGLHVMAGAVSGCVVFALQAPTVDAAPVVRCRECRYMVGAFTNNKIECAKGYKYMGLDSFCSCGARMDAPERVGEGQDE